MRYTGATYRIHSICLITLFVLGNTLLTFPSGEDAASGIYALAFSVITALPFFTIFGKIKLEEPRTLLDGRWGKAIAVPLLAVAFFGTLTCSRDYSLFIDTMRLPNTSLLVITGVFVALSFLLGLGSDKVLYLFSLVGFILVALVLFFIFLFSIPNMKWDYLGFTSTSDVSAIFRQGAGIFIHSFGQVLLLVFFLKGAKGGIFRQYIGLAVSALLLGITFLNVLGVLGLAVTEISYPYITVGEMVSLGVRYSRMEGFTYLVYFICALIKSSLLINVSFKIGSAFGGRFKKALYFVLPAVSLVGVSRWGREVFTSDPLNIVILIFELALPPLLLLKKGLDNSGN